MHQTNYTTTCTASNCQHSNKPAIIQSILAQLVPLGLFRHLFWKRTVLQCFDALGWPVKNLSGGVLAWLSVWSEMQACTWPSQCCCHSLSLSSVKSRLVFTFLILAHLGSPRKRAVKRVCVCVCCSGREPVKISCRPSCCDQ